MKQKTVLVIIASLAANPETSVTTIALNHFLETYQAKNQNDTIIKVNLNDIEKLNHSLTAKNMEGFFNAESDKLIEQLMQVDKLIITASMINFNIPPILKNWFDNILQPNKTFRYKYTDTSEGLVTNVQKAQLILSQGSSQEVYAHFDGFTDYLQGVLHFIGIEDINTINIDKTKTSAFINLPIEEKIDFSKIKKAAEIF